jgi:hypothetical protein
MDDDHHDALVGHHTNVTDDLSLDVNRANRNCARHDLSLIVMMDASRVNRNYVRHDLMTDGKMDGNLCHRMNDRLDDLNDLKMVVNLLNHNCAHRDPKMDVNLDAMSHRVMYY